MSSPPIEIQADWVQVPGEDLTLDAYLASPTQGSVPAVLVFQEIFGVNDHIREITRRLAQEGYVAIAPALYQRTAPGLELGYSDQDLKTGRAYKAQTKASELISDIQATIRYLQELPQVQSNAIGCIGFCFGGHVAYLAATLDPIRVTACFYGGGIATMTPGGGEPTLSRTPQISGRIELFMGRQDALIPVAEVNTLEQVLITHQIPHQIHWYDADHGFCCDQRSSYQPEAAQDAWIKVKQLFADTLKTAPVGS